MIIINPVDGNNSRLIKVLKQAHAAGIKIVVVDSQLKTSRFVDCTIMSDNYQAGVLCAKDLKSKKASAQILLLDHKGALSARDRIRGFTDMLKDDPNYKIVGTLDTQGQVEISMPQVEKFISQGTSFDTVMSLNDQSAIGMLAALEAKKVSHQVLVYSVDGSDNFRRIMATDPNASATAAQSPTKIGALAITNSYALVANKKVPRKILIPVYLIIQANMAQFESGWSL
ncbi:substrate-binding domain-containing protein [Ligilactobacillus apodemi]|uniref:substrate-binding domain-containing protein n=1 Tax=Ligilactobacillus apodemi TaxID=307126 RepID=UPI00214BCE97|nr:substrate-binding domain-containing protein [Ligilactobacillus apodemi]